MALSKKQIYNNALSKVSRSSISSVDEESYESNLCNSLYGKVEQEVLWEHTWSSQTKSVLLVETAADPLSRYGKSFQLPNDYVRLFNAYRSSDKQDFDFEYEIEGKLFLTDESTVYLKYIYRPPSPESMNMPLTNCVIQKLAIALAFPMKAKSDRENQLLVQYENNILPRAKSLDSQESRYIEFEENPWVESLFVEGP